MVTFALNGHYNFSELCVVGMFVLGIAQKKFARTVCVSVRSVRSVRVVDLEMNVRIWRI